MEETELDSINMSNLKLYKSQSESYRKAVRKIFFTCLKELPRELVIKSLKEKKIIKEELVNDKLKLVERK